MNCLLNAADQFLVKRNDGTEIVAGFPWFGTWGRDTFIALPGLTLSTGKIAIAGDIFHTMAKRMKAGLFPNTGNGEQAAYNSVDAPLWFIWALQQYEKYKDTPDIWKVYGKNIKSILEAYRQGTLFRIHMLTNGLIFAGEPGKALTWMDAVTPEGPVTPRTGIPVEISALWYNAVQQSLKWAENAGDKKFISEWEAVPEKIGRILHSDVLG